MSRARKKSLIRKKSKSKIFNRKKNRETKKGRGLNYQYECLFPTPDKNEITGKDSCTLIKLNDPDDPDYGLMGIKRIHIF